MAQSRYSDTPKVQSVIWLSQGNVVTAIERMFSTSYFVPAPLRRMMNLSAQDFHDRGTHALFVGNGQPLISEDRKEQIEAKFYVRSRRSLG